MLKQFNQEITEVVNQSIAKTMGLDESEIQSTQLLSNDLGMDSIDFLDILHGIEKRMKIQLQLGDFADYVRGPLSEEEFRDDNGVITQSGKAQMKQMFPQLNVNTEMHTRHIFQILSVEDFIVFIEHMKKREG